MSLPENLVSGLRDGFSSFEVGAGSNLKVVVSLISSALDDLSVNADDGAPVLGKLILVALSALEVEFSTVTEVFDPFTGAAAVLFDVEKFVIVGVLNGSSIALIEGLEIVVEFEAGQRDGALDSAVELGELAVDGCLAVLDGQIG